MATIEEIDKYCSLCMDINCNGCEYYDVHFRNENEKEKEKEKVKAKMQEGLAKEKAKRYDEIIEKASELLYVNDKGSLQCKTIESIIPELTESKENEDNRIREALIYHYQGDGCLCTNEYRIDYKDIRAWLESKSEKKPAEWSEEDEEIHRRCICAMRASACGFPEEEKFVEQVDNWLESLKGRVQLQPKQEWSEEDEDTIKFLISHFCVSHYNRSFQFTSDKLITHDELLEKIRNLRPHWKPSDNQIDALEHSLGDYNIKIFEDRYKILKSLYNDLKKLKA